MALTRPKLSTLVNRIAADFKARLPSTNPAVRRSAEYALSWVIGGASHLCLGHLEWAMKQSFPDVAEAEFLDRWGSIYSITRRSPTAATGTVIFTGTNATVIPAGTALEYDGNTYTTDDDATIASGQAEATITADVKGEDGNVAIGETMNVTDVIAGLNSTCVVGGEGIIDGTDQEIDDDYRDRILDRMRTPARGGGPGEYRLWALEVAGISKAWEFPLQYGIGTVGVGALSSNNTIPSASKIAEVQAYIDARAPVTAIPTVITPSEAWVTITFTSLTPNTAAVRASIKKTLEAWFLRKAEIGPQTILLSQLNEAISSAPGETDHVISSPNADLEYEFGEVVTFKPDEGKGFIFWP